MSTKRMCLCVFTLIVVAFVHFKRQIKDMSDPIDCYLAMRYLTFRISTKTSSDMYFLFYHHYTRTNSMLLNMNMNITSHSNVVRSKLIIGIQWCQIICWIRTETRNSSPHAHHNHWYLAKYLLCLFSISSILINSINTPYKNADCENSASIIHQTFNV